MIARLDTPRAEPVEAHPEQDRSLVTNGGGMESTPAIRDD